MNKIQEKRDEVQDLVDYYRKEIRRIASEVRDEDIIPFCETERVDFHALMDGFYFQREDTFEPLSDEEVPEDIRDLCYIEVDGLILASYMDNYYVSSIKIKDAVAHGKA